MCRDRPPPILHVFASETGEVGGYSVSAPIMDSPVTYYRPDGQPVGSFHIFATAEENAAARPIIDALSLRFPVQQTVVCPPAH